MEPVQKTFQDALTSQTEAMLGVMWQVELTNGQKTDSNPIWKPPPPPPPPPPVLLIWPGAVKE